MHPEAKQEVGKLSYCNNVTPTLYWLAKTGQDTDWRELPPLSRGLYRPVQA